MPDKQKMRAKARKLLDGPLGDQIRRENKNLGGYSPDNAAAGRGYVGGRKTPAIEALRRVKPDSDLSADVIREAYELDAARTPRRREIISPQVLSLRTGSSRQVGPMTEGTRRQTRRGVRGEAPRFVSGGCVRGDGIAMKGKTKGRMV